MNRIYASEDGKDCGEKAADTSLLAFKCGSMWAVYEMVGLSKPATVGAIATRYVYWTVPAVAMGATFAASGCVLGGIRGKDDFWNHMFAGASSAAIVGVRYGPKNGCLWAFLLGGVAGMCKYIKTCGFNITPASLKVHKDVGWFDHYNRHIGPRGPTPLPPDC